MLCWRRLLLGLAITALLARLGHADATLIDDAYTSSSSASTKFGRSPTILVDESKATGYLRFSLSGTLPAGTKGRDVAEATLKLFVNKVEESGSFNVVRVTERWNEKTISHSNRPALGSVEVAGIPISSSEHVMFVVVDVTALVRDWLDNVLPNNGVALVANGSTKFIVNSKENPQRHPALEIVTAHAD